MIFNDAWKWIKNLFKKKSKQSKQFPTIDVTVMPIWIYLVLRLFDDDRHIPSTDFWKLVIEIEDKVQPFYYGFYPSTIHNTVYDIIAFGWIQSENGIYFKTFEGHWMQFMIKKKENF